MVLASGSSLLPDDGPLALLRLRRAEAEAQLPKSLMIASLLALTFVVALLLAQMLFHPFAAAPPPEIPQVLVPIDILNVYTPMPDGAVIVPPVDPATVNGDIKPVDDQPIVAETKIFDPAKDGTTPVVDPGKGTGVLGRSGGESVPTPVPDPDPNVPAFVEKFPEVVTKVAPAYPPLPRDAGMEGTVLVRMLVGVDGRVKRAELEKSSPMFDEAALAAARQWTFTPATSNGNAVPVWVRVPFRFQLHE